MDARSPRSPQPVLISISFDSWLAKLAWLLSIIKLEPGVKHGKSLQTCFKVKSVDLLETNENWPPCRTFLP